MDKESYAKASRDYSYKMPGKYQRSEKQTIIQALIREDGSREDVLITKHVPVATWRYGGKTAILHETDRKYAETIEDFLIYVGAVAENGVRPFDYAPYRRNVICPWLSQVEDGQRRRRNRERGAGSMTPAIIRQLFFSGLEKASRGFMSVEFLNRCCLYVSRSGMEGAAAVWDLLTGIMQRHALFLDDAGIWRVAKEFRSGLPYEQTQPRVRAQDFVPVPHAAVAEILALCEQELPNMPQVAQNKPAITRKGQRVRAYDGTLVVTLHPSKYQDQIITALDELFMKIRSQQADMDLLA